MKRRFSSLFCLFILGNCYSQEFKFQAKVDSVNETAYYKIALSPELLGQINLDASDLRLVDSEGKEIPYFVAKEKEGQVSSSFISYEILEKTMIPDSSSAVVFHNTAKKKMDNITFVVQNTDVRKRARLSGSNDRENWFIIKDDYLLHSMKNTTETSEFKLLNFPLSDYEFLKLEMNDKNQMPINILKIGYKDSQLNKGIVTSFQCPITSKKDSLGKTTFQVKFQQPMYIERLGFNIIEPEYFSRNAEVKVEKERRTKKKKRQLYFENIGSNNLNSNGENTIDVRPTKTESLFIEIQNGDDIALSIDGITASYLNMYIVAELVPSQEYYLKFGDETLSNPSYDIVKFKEKITPSEAAVSHHTIEELLSQKEEIKSDSLFDNPAIVWSVLGVVGIGLAIVSFRMIKEM